MEVHERGFDNGWRTICAASVADYAIYECDHADDDRNVGPGRHLLGAVAFAPPILWQTRRLGLGMPILQNQVFDSPLARMTRVAAIGPVESTVCVQPVQRGAGARVAIAESGGGKAVKTPQVKRGGQARKEVEREQNTDTDHGGLGAVGIQFTGNRQC